MPGEHRVVRPKRLLGFGAFARLTKNYAIDKQKRRSVRKAECGRRDSHDAIGLVEKPRKNNLDEMLAAGIMPPL